MPLLEAKRTGFSNPRSIGDIIYSADGDIPVLPPMRSEEHTSELQSQR